jgi:hypothetical protein
MCLLGKLGSVDPTGDGKMERWMELTHDHVWGSFSISGAEPLGSEVPIFFCSKSLEFSCMQQLISVVCLHGFMISDFIVGW